MYYELKFWNSAKELQKVDAKLTVNNLCFQKYFHIGKVFVYFDYQDLYFIYVHIYRFFFSFPGKWMSQNLAWKDEAYAVLLCLYI